MSLNFLSRTLDPTDFMHLTSELPYVDHHLPQPKHLGERWAYALALHAVGRWVATGRRTINDTLYDVGGGGSKFHFMLDDFTRRDTVVIETALSGFAVGGTPLADVITAHSVMEHALAPEHALYQMSCLLAPGGLLVLTFAFWPHCGPDLAVGHEHRRRIYCPQLYTRLRQEAQVCQLQTFGGLDSMFHGKHIDDYTMASLVLEKRR